MQDLIDIHAYPVRDCLDRLLKDKTTGKNIIFATDNYIHHGQGYSASDEITVDALNGFEHLEIQPRVSKTIADQQSRTRKKAEVFTPTWIVKQMTDHAAQMLSKGVKWTTYVKRRIMEITCGEAPFLVNRYDTTTGELIPVDERVGLLGRKLRVVRDNTDNEKDFIYWATKAYQYTYGYEYQGDSLLIARINMLLTFVDNYRAGFDKDPDGKSLNTIANIISWNIFQMDGITDCVPAHSKSGVGEQLALFDAPAAAEEAPVPVKIYDHNADKNKTKLFSSIKGGFTTMKFDFVIGNPPYQDDVQNQGDRPNPIYNIFMDSAFSVSDCVELITPARFLFNAGQTPKEWNKKMLNDEHFKVLFYEPDCTKVFANTDIKGGVAITYRDKTKNFGAIDVFTPYNELNAIVRKVNSLEKDNMRLNSIIASQGLFRFSDKFFSENPNAVSVMGAGTGNKIVSSVMEKLPDVFLEICPDNDNYIRFLGRINSKRLYRYIRRDYLINNDYIDVYKLFLPEANNAGKFGETLTEPVIGYPKEGSADTFLSAGHFKHESECGSMIRYIKTKFFRALLGVKKVTQHCPPSVWSTIPLQDFTDKSDIDWTKSVHEIDEQLYRKYGLSVEEIDFIESHVKEME